MRVRPRELLHRAGVHWELPGDEIEQQHAEAVEIALHRRALAAENLGREVERRPDEAVGAGKLLAGAEIHEHQAPAALAHDVLGLDVAVQQPGAVHRRQRRAQIQADEGRFARAKWPARLNGLLERLAAHELHPQADAAVVLLGTIHLHDVPMTHTREPARLVEQPPVSFGMVPLVVQQLERDFTVQRRIPRAVDLARRALADAIEERQASPMRTTGAGVERLVGTAAGE